MMHWHDLEFCNTNCNIKANPKFSYMRVVEGIVIEVKLRLVDCLHFQHSPPKKLVFEEIGHECCLHLKCGFLKTKKKLPSVKSIIN